MYTPIGRGYRRRMTTVAGPLPQVGTAGAALRRWRELRRLTQLELSGRCGVSTRHLSYVETGRARPSSRLVLHLCEHLEVPLRHRNEILLAAGFAPEYPEHELREPPLAAVNAAITAILAAHEPLPALAVDGHWNLVAGTTGLWPLTTGCAPPLLEPPVNVLRLSLHPHGLAPRIANLGQWRAHLLHRLASQARHSGDPVLTDLLTELREYPGGTDDSDVDPQSRVLVPLLLRRGADVLSLLSTTTVFGTPTEITVAELAIEAFYPGDAATARALGVDPTPFGD